MKLIARFCAPLIALICLSPAAQSAIVSCPGTAATTDREFTLNTTPDSACLAFGTGNINGNNDTINQLGYITLDKSDDLTSGALAQSITITSGSGTSGLSGAFTISAPGYTNFVIGLKSGQGGGGGPGGIDPDWAAFAIPNGASLVNIPWTISGQQALSHINLYAQVVPLPAAIWLFASGLIGFAALRRRKSWVATSRPARSSILSVRKHFFER